MSHAHSIPRLLSALPRVGRTVRVLDLVALWRQRRQLARLGSERLDDLGLTPQQARREAARAIWDVPQHWMY